MALESSSLNLPQIQGVLEASLNKYFDEWVKKTESPLRKLDQATSLVSKQLNQAIIDQCPSVSGYKIVVVSLATPQVGLRLRLSRCRTLVFFLFFS